MIVRRHTSALRTLVLGVAIGLLVVAPAFGHSGGTNDEYPYSVEHAGISDATYWPPDAGIQYNGWKIYLSPAHHWGGYNYGCSTYIEDTAMVQAADEAAHGAGWDLRARGYYVRVGAADPDENVTRSNGWGSGSKRRHIAIHSNANPDSGGCTSSPDDTGTKAFYWSSSGKALAKSLLEKVGPASPGGESTTQADDLKKRNWHELTATSMVAAYLEAEFHDWSAGKNWLWAEQNWAWRIGWAVDTNLGYP
ncbi:MAG TPA: hypothetical protein ENH15_00070 [Actinobacteria bacterium]|nr:hypothetical protein [Actinomycetota bacterium]